MHTFALSPEALIMAIVLVLSPWVFLLIYLADRRRSERMWRETLVYLKSASAYEAEDSIDRIVRREKTVIEKGLAKVKKKRENLSDSPATDMADDIRGALEKQYSN